MSIPDTLLSLQFDNISLYTYGSITKLVARMVVAGPRMLLVSPTACILAINDTHSRTESLVAKTLAAGPHNIIGCYGSEGCVLETSNTQIYRVFGC